ncbi:MAG TPA: VOC family protein, partial [Mycobacterium sp.]|nr:VOC family protein [Mycobacterium sp.]
GRPHIAAVGLQVPDAAATSRRAAELMAPVAYRRTYAAEQVLGAAVAPDGTEMYWVTEPAWVDEFENGLPQESTPVRGIDHVNLSQPWQTLDDAVLFLTSVLGLSADVPTEVPGPKGLVRSQSMRSPDASVRLLLNVAPHVLHGAGMPQHVAFSCSDVIALARSMRARGALLLPVPDNYYDYLAGRFGLGAAIVEDLRELGLLYDRDAHGEFLHFYTRTVGTVFFEFVQRRGQYDGYGTENAPVRLAAQRARRVGTVRA